MAGHHLARTVGDPRPRLRVGIKVPVFGAASICLPQTSPDHTAVHGFSKGEPRCIKSGESLLKLDGGERVGVAEIGEKLRGGACSLLMAAGAAASDGDFDAWRAASRKPGRILVSAA